MTFSFCFCFAHDGINCLVCFVLNCDELLNVNSIFVWYSIKNGQDGKKKDANTRRFEKKRMQIQEDSKKKGCKYKKIRKKIYYNGMYIKRILYWFTYEISRESLRRL